MQVKHESGSIVLDNVELVGAVTLVKGSPSSPTVPGSLVKVRLTEEQAWQLLMEHRLAICIDEARKYNREAKQRRILELEAELKQLKDTL